MCSGEVLVSPWIGSVFLKQRTVKLKSEKWVKMSIANNTSKYCNLQHGKQSGLEQCGRMLSVRSCWLFWAVFWEDDTWVNCKPCRRWQDHVCFERRLLSSLCRIAQGGDEIVWSGLHWSETAEGCRLEDSNFSARGSWCVSHANAHYKARTSTPSISTDEKMRI